MTNHIIDMEKKAASFETSVMAHKERLRAGGTRLLDEEKFRKKFVIKYPQLLNKCIEESNNWESKYNLKLFFQCGLNHASSGKIQLGAAAKKVLESYKNMCAGSRISKEKALSLTDVFNTNVEERKEEEEGGATEDDLENEDDKEEQQEQQQPSLSSKRESPSTTAAAKKTSPRQAAVVAPDSFASSDSGKKVKGSRNSSGSVTRKKVEKENQQKRISSSKARTSTNSSKRVTRSSQRTAAKSEEKNDKSHHIANNEQRVLSPACENIPKEISKSKLKSKREKKKINKRASTLLKSVVEQTFAAVNGGKACRSPCSPRIKKTKRMIQEAVTRRQSGSENMSDNIGGGAMAAINGGVIVGKKPRRRKRGNMRELFAMTAQQENK